MQQILSSKLNNTDVYCFDCVDSTNNKARQLINGSNPLLIVANEQTAGRGRQGKSFFSPKGTGIYMTYVAHPMAKIKQGVAITTATCVAVCKAIENMTHLNPQIKWVNDIYINGKKVCGILCEAVNDYQQGIIKSVIIGIGINVSTHDFPQDVPNATSLDVEINNADLICQIVKELEAIINSPFGNFADYYKDHSLIIGEEIEYTLNGEKITATATDIDSDGGLMITHSNGTVATLSSGEITIRKKAFD